MHDFDFDFRVRRPEGEVGRWTEQFWFARGTVPSKRELIASTGSTVVLLDLVVDHLTAQPTAEDHQALPGVRRTEAQLDPRRAVSRADLAARQRWADQAHFSRDFERHTGVSPTRYLQIQRALPDRRDAPGFTPGLADPR